jgi:hypothetical protein
MQEALERGREEYLETEHREAVQWAYRAWKRRGLWRWVPPRLRRRAFARFGRRFVPEFVATWKTNRRAENWGEVRTFLHPGERVVVGPRVARMLEVTEAAIHQQMQTRAYHPTARLELL